MRPSSSKESATGETTLGSLAASSTLKPSRMTNVLAASAGSTAGKRGRSLGSTSGSAATAPYTDARARTRMRRGGMRECTNLTEDNKENEGSRRDICERDSMCLRLERSLRDGCTKRRRFCNVHEGKK